MSWIETTLRKGTKTPKICRDMFITDSRGSWAFCEVKSGRMVTRTPIEEDEAKEYINNENLICCKSIFNNCFTFRTKASAELIETILAI